MYRSLSPVAASIATLACLGFAACGSDDTQTTKPAAAPATPAAGATQDLVGTFQRRMTKADIARTQKLRSEAGPLQEKPKPSRLTLVLTAAELRLTDSGFSPPLIVRQSITPTAGKLGIDGYIRPDVGSFCGPEIPQNAAYTWTRAGDVLTLTAADDRCADRDSSLTGDWKLRG
jgi:hypothetical protein